MVNIHIKICHYLAGDKYILILIIISLVIFYGIQAYKEYDNRRYHEKYGSEAMWQKQWEKLTKHSKRKRR